MPQPIKGALKKPLMNMKRGMAPVKTVIPAIDLIQESSDHTVRWARDVKELFTVPADGLPGETSELHALGTRMSRFDKDLMLKVLRTLNTIQRQRS